MAPKKPTDYNNPLVDKLPKKLNFQQIGGSGLTRTGWISEEFLPQLRGLNGVKVYREMLDNDAVIGAFMVAIKLLLRTVEWRLDPADESAAAQEAVDFVQGALFEDMDQPFGDFIAEVLSFLGYGYDLHEIVYKIRGGPDAAGITRRSKFDDGLVGIRKLAHRAQDTIIRWYWDDDMNIAGVQQMLPDSGFADIPAEKLLHFRTETTKGNPEGRSILRNSYVGYVRKNTIESAEGRSALRAAGVVQFRIPAKYMDPSASDDEKAVYVQYQALAASLAQDRQGAVIIPSDVDEQGKPFFELSYVTTQDRKPSDMTKIIERIDKRIAASVLADFILLGQQAVGSFALSSDKTELFGHSLKAYLGIIQDQLQNTLLPRLWKMNSFDPELMPKLMPGSVQPTSLAELGTYIMNLAQAGAPIFPNEELMDHLMEVANLPPPDPDAIPKGMAAPGQNPDGTPLETQQEPTE